MESNLFFSQNSNTIYFDASINRLVKEIISNFSFSHSNKKYLKINPVAITEDLN